VAQAAAAAAHAGHPLPAARPGASVPAAVLHQALATGISRGFLVAAGIAVVALVVAVAMIRVRREDLAGAQAPTPADPARAEAEVSDQVPERLELAPVVGAE
jgi:hypothetical protein